MTTPSRKHLPAKEKVSAESDRLRLLGRATSLEDRGLPSPVSIDGLEESLEVHNPVAALSRADFLQLLAMLVECERFAHGKPRTATTLTLSTALEVLTGQKPFEYLERAMAQPFSLGELACLNLSPVTVFCYRRIVAEMAALRTERMSAS